MSVCSTRRQTSSNLVFFSRCCSTEVEVRQALHVAERRLAREELCLLARGAAGSFAATSPGCGRLGFGASECAGLPEQRSRRPQWFSLRPALPSFSRRSRTPFFAARPSSPQSPATVLCSRIACGTGSIAVISESAEGAFETAGGAGRSVVAERPALASAE